MRAEFVDALAEEAETDDRILLLTGDLGFGALEPFAERFPGRFFNVGVAEQNMAGMSTGLAESGFVPFLYSIATFASMRPYEFIRNGPVAHGLPVRIVGMGGGFDYGVNGLTHYALEDVSVMRTQPRLTVLVPADADQARAAVRATNEVSGPVYLRLEKLGPPVPGLDGRFNLGRAELIGNGRDVALVVMGGLAHEAVLAAELLGEEGIDASVVVVSAFNPSPAADLVDVLDGIPLTLSVESHYLVGGLGSFVCEVVAEHALRCRVVRCGVTQVPRGVTGSRESLHELHGLDGPALARKAMEELSATSLVKET